MLRLAQKDNLFKKGILFLSYGFQACGKKVVAFDVCSHPEVVKNGLLIKKDDIEGFANAIIRLLKENFK